MEATDSRNPKKQNDKQAKKQTEQETKRARS